jgi:hypothetical protein
MKKIIFINDLVTKLEDLRGIGCAVIIPKELSIQLVKSFQECESYVAENANNVADVVIFSCSTWSPIGRRNWTERQEQIQRLKQLLGEENPIIYLNDSLGEYPNGALMDILQVSEVVSHEGLYSRLLQLV